MGVFQQGLSGLNTSQKNLEVIANNVSNANTVGFKGSAALFGDVFSATLGSGGASGLAVGSGSQLNAVRQQFKQGNVLATGNPLDMAINGDGFFKVKTDKGQEIYTRNGQFTLDKDGVVVNADGNKLMAFPIDPETGRPLDVAQPLVISQDQLVPRVTTEAKIRFNLDSRIEPAQGDFDPKNLETYSFSTNQVVFDQLGEPKNLSVYWRKTDTPGQWQVYNYLEGQQVQVGEPGGPQTPFATLQFDTDGKIDTDTARFTLDVGAVDAGFITDGDNSGEIAIDMRNSSQFGSGFNIQDLSQNGFDAASYAGFTIDESGKLSINYANGQSSAVAKIGLFRFKNPEGLQPIGNNGWIATLQAGAELTSTSDDNAFGVIQSGAVEEANIDLTAELVAMISAQRVYQANSQSIKTQDSLLQTVTNLR